MPIDRSDVYTLSSSGVLVWRGCAREQMNFWKPQALFSRVLLSTLRVIAAVSSCAHFRANSIVDGCVCGGPVSAFSSDWPPLPMGRGGQK
jgi:hypothetical protein